MIWKAERVEGNTQKGRPEIFTHRTNWDFLKERFPAMAEVSRAILANRIESTAEYWFNLGQAVEGDFDTLYNQKKRAEQ